MWTRLKNRLLINRAIRKKQILVWYNPLGNYINCKIWEHGITEYITIFEKHDKRLYNKLKRLFPTRWL